MRAVQLFRACISAALLAGSATPVLAQAPDTETRESVIESAQADKVPKLQPYVPSKGEQVITKIQDTLLYSTTRWRPYFENAYRGGGFALGAAYLQHVSSYNFIDIRGSYSIRAYKRIEAEFVAPELFHRRARLSVLGGWREATQVGFFGTGTSSSLDDRANYGLQQPVASAFLTVKPTRRYLTLIGGAEWSRVLQQPGEGSYPSVETKYTPETLPGLGAQPTYLRTQGTVGFDWRPAPAYARRGGFYGVTFNDFADRDKAFGFRRIDYEAVQHVPILREAWAISLHGLVSTTSRKTDQDIPFFLLPSLGGGSNLRGFSSWRFRDRHSLLLQAEWRIMVNRFIDTAVFYDAGKVTSRAQDLDFDGLKSDYGFGVRFHSPFATALRIDIARSNEGTSLVFATGAAF